MSNFLTRIKNLLNDPRQSYIRDGGVSKALIPVEDLRELLAHFEALDSAARSEAGERDEHTTLRRRLHNCVLALWHNNGNSGEEVNYVVAKALIPMIEARENNKWVQGQMTAARKAFRESQPMPIGWGHTSNRQTTISSTKYRD